LSAGLRRRPTGGAYSASPDPLAGFRGLTYKGRGEEGKEEEGRRGEEWERRRGSSSFAPGRIKVGPYVSAIGKDGEDGFWTPAIPPRDV